MNIPATADEIQAFLKDLQKHHLSQVIASKYDQNPLILGQHFDINVTPLVPEDAFGDDPARKSTILLISIKPKYKSPKMGNVMIPANMKGQYR